VNDVFNGRAGGFASCLHVLHNLPRLSFHIPQADDVRVVRDQKANAEVPLQTYAQLEQPLGGGRRRILAGLSCRE
jgi:hypothetical protein